jgi:4-hydroxy-3-methylbut-2-en-1-yl diphosphate synthase IspG/GcpE
VGCQFERLVADKQIPIGREDRVKEVVASALDNNIPIRIGVNAGSLEKDLQKKYVDVYY